MSKQEKNIFLIKHTACRTTYLCTRERELLKIDIYLKEAFFSTLAQACLGFIVNEEGYLTGEAPMHSMLI